MKSPVTSIKCNLPKITVKYHNAFIKNGEIAWGINPKSHSENFFKDINLSDTENPAIFTASSYPAYTVGVN